jgi:predicted dehydrogenase
VHAEIDRVPGNLCVSMPDAVGFDEGCFACVGSIALHGIRQAGVALGERVVIIGLGLVGQLTGMILRAAGCTVVGVDIDETLVVRARVAGVADACFVRGDLDGDLPEEVAGSDAVIVTAATASNDPIELAPRLCRDRGRVVIVGDVGLQVPRAPYYDKEIDLRLSRSYGPGRYDREYEEHGRDYPIGYVRWTEGRNMRAIVELIGAGRLPVSELITERIPVEEAVSAYENLAGGGSSPLGVVIEYAESSPRQPTGSMASKPTGAPDTASVIGTGSFAQRILIPGLRSAGIAIDTVASATGLSAHAAAQSMGAKEIGTPQQAFESDAGLIAIATRHDSHAKLAEQSMRAGKAVFVEKPPCLTQEELDRLREARSETRQVLAVGFNRRHAPHAIQLRDHLAGADGPRQILIRVSAGKLPSDHWLNDPDEGGGRLLGEGCHFVDLACWLADSAPSRVQAMVQPLSHETTQTAQRFIISLAYPDGSLATVFYSDQGSRRHPKEYIEAHAGDRSAVLDDFRVLTLMEGSSRRKVSSRRRNKGHLAQLVALQERLKVDPAEREFDPLDSMEAVLLAKLSAERGIDCAND